MQCVKGVEGSRSTEPSPSGTDLWHIGLIPLSLYHSLHLPAVCVCGRLCVLCSSGLPPHADSDAIRCKSYKTLQSPAEQSTWDMLSTAQSASGEDRKEFVCVCVCSFSCIFWTIMYWGYKKLRVNVHVNIFVKLKVRIWSKVKCRQGLGLSIAFLLPVTFKIPHYYHLVNNLQVCSSF